ncbi:MAG: response regulator [Treponema sp.]|jgi:signal transduction histidine kinase/CheY-like chemotaxis protein|nr:response regulator [Treponema sp.]
MKKPLWKAVPKKAKKSTQILLVFGAFFIMVLTGYLFVRGILWNRLLESSDWSLSAVEARIRSAFAEADTSLLNTYHTVQSMIISGANNKELLRYLTATTGWMQQQEGELRLYGIYGYIRGEFIDSMGLNPGDDYIPQQRPWYQTAVRNSGKTAYTAPYKDALTGEVIISAVRNIDNERGGIDGILALNLNISRLNEYIQNLSLSKGGYGILLSQNMHVVAHPQESMRMRPMEELGNDYQKLARLLRTGESVSAMRIRDSNSKKALVFFRPLFNGWYVGLVTPYYSFYRDLYYAGLMLSALGLILAFSLGIVLLRLEAARIRSDEESRAKSSFLARMSHEIRTPMNAIIGMGELALRSQTLPKMAEYVREIKQAGANLLSLINDILDFSKIEAGNLEITAAPYQLSSLLNDVINVSRVRISEKPILFTVNVDSCLPGRLLGDEARIRQILLNLLSNAAKYTREGYIALDVSAVQENGDGRLILSMEVADSGIGIQAADLPGLFGNFVRLDMAKNKNIEGTGLGLAITRSLCRAMGGDITVQSEYGSGSGFTAKILQARAPENPALPLAAVENPQAKAVLLCDHQSRRAASLARTLENLGVPFMTAGEAELFALLEMGGGPESGPWAFVFVSSRLYTRAAAFIQENRLPAVPVLLAELGDLPSFENAQAIVSPAYAVPVANLLNGRETKAWQEKTEVRFIAPKARILIVDDIATNLTVAEGLLAPYRMEVSACLSGREAVELVKRREWDIVFMDHMMPGMDGAEAAALIRAWETEQNSAKGETRKPVSIIALTANAISGMREMFLEKGFNDYLSKPIEIAKLNEILGKWIPQEKQIKGGEVSPLTAPDRFAGRAAQPPYVTRSGSVTPQSRGAPPPATPPGLPPIPGLDTVKGIAATGGTVAGYRQVLAIFSKDVQERLPLLQKEPPPESLPLFTTQVHALKSAAASIGASAISAEAARLEAAGKSGDIALIRETLDGFAQRLAELARSIRAALGESAAAGDQSGRTGLGPLFGELAGAVQAQKTEAIDRLLEELGRQPLDSNTRETLEQISNQVLIAEFDSALLLIKEVLHENE